MQADSSIITAKLLPTATRATAATSKSFGIPTETPIVTLDPRRKNAFAKVRADWATQAVPQVIGSIGTATVEIKRGISDQIGYAESLATQTLLEDGINDPVDARGLAWIFYHVTAADASARPVQIHTLLTHVEEAAADDGGAGV